MNDTVKNYLNSGLYAESNEFAAQARFEHGPNSGIKTFELGQDLQKANEHQKEYWGDISKTIAKDLNLKDPEIYQYIGDSGDHQLSTDGVEFTKNIMKNTMNASNHIILYGGTGYSSEKDGYDINGCVNDLISADSRYANRAVANIVNGGTYQALTGWGATIPDACKNYFLVHNGKKDESKLKTEGVGFGGDIIASDSIATKTIIFEGGPQCLDQAVNSLKDGKPVESYSGLRTKERKDLFSTAQLLSRVKEVTTAIDFNSKSEDERKGLVTNKVQEYLSELREPFPDGTKAKIDLTTQYTKARFTNIQKACNNLINNLEKIDFDKTLQVSTVDNGVEQSRTLKRQ